MTAYATAALAFIGAVSIVANFFLVRAAFRQAKAATRESEASRDLIKETQRDRELAYRPFLSFESPKKNPLIPHMEAVAAAERLIPGLGPIGVRISSMEVDVANVGKGVAIACQYFAYFVAHEGQLQSRTALFASDPVDVGAGQRRTLTTRQLKSADAPATISDLVGEKPAESSEVLLCVDQFDKKYRFQRGVPLPEIWPDDDQGLAPPPWTCGIGVEGVPIATPSDAFLAALNPGISQSRPYIAATIQAVPLIASSFSEDARNIIKNWVNEVKPTAEAIEWGNERVSYVARGEPTEIPSWQATFVPGPVVEVRRAAPSHGTVALSVPEALAWWISILEQVGQLAASFQVGDVFVGLAALTAASGEWPRITDLDFADAPPPNREVSLGAARNWSAYLHSPVPRSDLAARTPMELLPSLLFKYGYSDCEETLDWLRDNVASGKPR